MGDSGSGVGRGTGSGCKQGSSPVSPNVKGSKNKRKLADPSLEKTISLPSSLTEFPRYESSSEASPNSPSDFVPSGEGSNQPKEGMVGEFRVADWDDPIACQLEELLLCNLHTIFQSAIEKIVACGYSEEIAEKAISRHSLYCRGNDLVSSVVDDALAYLKRGKEFDALRDHLFDDLQHLVEYTMLEMICMLREVRPSLSVPEAMWWLLICDLNISQACALNGDPSLSVSGGKEVAGGSSSDSTLHQLKLEPQSSETILPKPYEPHVPEPPLPDAHNSLPETLRFGSFSSFSSSGTLDLNWQTPEKERLVSMPDSVKNPLGASGECTQTTSQTSVSEEKGGAGRKGHTKKELAALRQKSFHMDKNYRAYGSKGAFKTGKLASIDGFVVEKRLKSPSEISGVHMKIASSKTSMEVGINVSVADRSCHVSTNSVLALPVTPTSTLPTKDNISALPTTTGAEFSVSSTSEKKPASQLNVSTSDSETSKTPADYYFGIPYDASVGKYTPQDEKDELILKLVPRLQGLEKELQGWTEWANQKVMQAARRLRKDQAEIKTMRREKEEAEQFRKEKQMLEENTMKRLSEMELALGNATGQFERGNSTGHRLEVENSTLNKMMEVAKLRALESASTYQGAMDREQKTLKKAQSLEGQKGLLQEELETEKHKVVKLQQEVGKENNVHNQIEARWKQERAAREKLLAQASSIRKEREQLESLAKAEEDTIRQKAENEIQKYKEDINKLESKLSELKWKSDCSRLAALRTDIDGSGGSSLGNIKSAPALKGNQNPKIFKRVAIFHENSRTGALKQERECVMCLSEEMSVVFLPCAHQVLCAKCNELHEKEGMKDCPSCRTPIQQRINVGYARP